MTDDFGVDLDEVFKVIEAADVLVVRFHIVQLRLLVDFRVKTGVKPFLTLVPRAESVEDRFRSIKKLRPELPFPEKVMSFNWPRSTPVMVNSGVWQRMVDRLSALGDEETIEMAERVLEEILAEERREVQGAIMGAEHYQTLWERQRA